MPCHIRMIFLLWASLLIIRPLTAFAWHDYAENQDDNWDYHGSGRDHPYSQYIDRKNYIGYADYAYLDADYFDPSSYTLNGPVAVSPVSLAPVLPAAPPQEFTVNIPNKRGGFTTVVIKRSGSGFIGPQGEYYPEFPKVFQLEIIYGK